MLKPNLPLCVGKTETSKTSLVPNIEIVDGIKNLCTKLELVENPVQRSWWLPLNHHFWNAEIIPSRDNCGPYSQSVKRTESLAAVPGTLRRSQTSRPADLSHKTSSAWWFQWEGWHIPWIIPWWHPLGIIWLSHDYEMENKKSLKPPTSHWLTVKMVIGNQYLL